MKFRGTLIVAALLTAPVAAQMSAQSRSVRMQSRRSATDSSPRQASAHDEQIVAHAADASRASASSLTSSPSVGFGWDLIISEVLMRPRYRCEQL